MITSPDGCNTVVVPPGALTNDTTGRASVAGCCDPVANHWTFQTCDFSQMQLGDPSVDLAPGGTGKTDCLVEWGVNDPQSTPALDRNGFPPATRVCRDGDATCDGDGQVNGVCAFGVSACLNAGDARLATTRGGCVPTAITSLTVKPWPDSLDPIDAANAVALRNVVSGLGTGSVGGAHAEQVVFAPPVAEGDLCTALVSVAVPLAAPSRQGTKNLSFTASATPEPGKTRARRDKDRIKLVCAPAGAP